MITTDWSLEGTARRRDRFYAATQRKFVPFKEPIVFRRGSMQYLWDNEGRKYIDLLGMNVCISVGHSHPRVVDAAMQQARDLIHSTTMFYHPVPAHLAEEISLTLPGGGGIEWVAHFTSSGAEAVDLALTMARRHAGVADIIALRSGYHGPTLGAQSVTGISGFRHGPGLPGNVVFVADPNQYRGVFGAWRQALPRRHRPGDRHGNDRPGCRDDRGIGPGIRRDRRNAAGIPVRRGRTGTGKGRRSDR